MWEMFDRLTLEGKTLTRIRELFKQVEDDSLDDYIDTTLIIRMIRTCRGALPVGAD